MIASQVFRVLLKWGFNLNNSLSDLNWVISLHPSKSISISGFKYADDVLHMIEWLGRGKNFCQFVVNDIETELYNQDPQSQLLSVECIGKPECETKVRAQVKDSSKGIVSQFSITFPLKLSVRAGTGEEWLLEVHLNYSSKNMDIPEKLELTLNFNIINAIMS